MSGGEILLTIVVAIIVFGPNKLPMLAEHLGKLFRHFAALKQQATTFWQEQLNQQQLQDNLRKAERADALYQRAGDVEEQSVERKPPA
ncbi:sec-independent protein translocase protein TatB [Legionella lansingensis]|uniref:TatB protein (Twin arginine translocation) n=1 Tax=Legionella lansingensis TaxID=45067 RepID=A0A0W0VEQ0_9GAMM|nr:twin-arginine translocase TatA/TatE family subunit [Legionella lansingensis]KTD18599.1 TatB protein (twin arginine translocation) [Legionella lansingensis]SNV43443.1 sec-independent protein translocase protein TatB [Legionella lansingensis]